MTVDRDAAGAAGETYYDVLGLAPGADPAEIEEAYADLGVMFAAGKVPASRQEYARKQRTRLAAAYATLADPALRAAYDRRLGLPGRAAAVPGPAAPPAPPHEMATTPAVAAALEAVPLAPPAGPAQPEREPAEAGLVPRPVVMPWEQPPAAALAVATLPEETIVAPAAELGLPGPRATQPVALAPPEEARATAPPAAPVAIPEPVVVAPPSLTAAAEDDEDIAAGEEAEGDEDIEAEDEEAEDEEAEGDEEDDEVAEGDEDIVAEDEAEGDAEAEGEDDDEYEPPMPPPRSGRPAARGAVIAPPLPAIRNLAPTAPPRRPAGSAPGSGVRVEPARPAARVAPAPPPRTGGVALPTRREAALITARQASAPPAPPPAPARRPGARPQRPAEAAADYDEEASPRTRYMRQAPAPPRRRSRKATNQFAYQVMVLVIGAVLVLGTVISIIGPTIGVAPSSGVQPTADATGLIKQGDDAIQKQDWAGAIQAFQGALQVQPTNVNAMLGLVLTYQGRHQAGDAQLAQNYATQIIKTDPNSAAAKDAINVLSQLSLTPAPAATPAGGSSGAATVPAPTATAPGGTGTPKP